MLWIAKDGVLSVEGGHGVGDGRGISESGQAAGALARLHRLPVVDPVAIRRILTRLRKEAVWLYGGLNRKIEAQWTRITALDYESFSVSELSRKRGPLLFQFSLDGEAYIFESNFVDPSKPSGSAIAIPTEILRRERRCRERLAMEPTDYARIQIDGAEAVLSISERSPEGLSLMVPRSLSSKFVTGGEHVLTVGRQECSGVVRHRTESRDLSWLRVGLSTSPLRSELARQVTSEIVSAHGSMARGVSLLRAGSTQVRLAADAVRRRLGVSIPQSEPRVVSFTDNGNRGMVGLLDGWGSPSESVAVVIPPAWGRTKETLMPLALTLLGTFRRARIPIQILRFDGVNKRGESFREDGCREPGKENHRFTFSQGVVDISSAVSYLGEICKPGPRFTVLVSFSAASIEARRAVLEDSRIDGWISVVGSADLQSMMTRISGGIDFATGVERGISFGLQEILGVEVDMDLAGRDALDHRLVYLSDAKRDMAEISTPITWISGKHDAWMDAERVRDAMSCGDVSNRRHVEVPTGHALRSSTEALDVFGYIAAEVARLAGAAAVKPSPEIVEISRRSRFERARLQRYVSSSERRQFWERYLLGRDSSGGIDLMTETSAYKALMDRQIDELRLSRGDLVGDLGAGTGAFVSAARANGSLQGLKIVAADFVRSGLERSRSRIANSGNVLYVEANLDTGNSIRSIPIASGSLDAILASLVISYLPDPRSFLMEGARLLRRGGRLVLSSLRPDADMSKLFSDGAIELRAQWGTDALPWSKGLPYESSIRAYLNEAAILLDLEESGAFRFWDEQELADLVREVGFNNVRVERTFGDPAQAIVVSGTRN